MRKTGLLPLLLLLVAGVVYAGGPAHTSALPSNLDVTTTFPSTFVGGATISYFITVTNRAAVDVQNVQIVNTPSSPDGYYLYPGIQQSGPAFACTTAGCKGSLPAGTSATFRFTMYTLPDSWTDPLGNVTTVTDGDLGTEVSVAGMAQPSRVYDVAVMSWAPTQSNPGVDLPVSIVVDDESGSSVDNATMTLETPPGTTFLSIDPSANCTTPAPGSAGTIVCQTGKLSPQAAGQPASTRLAASYTVHLRAPLTGGTLYGTATATALNDAAAWNNTSTFNTLIMGPLSADLSVSLSAPAQIGMGSAAVFTATVHNDGPLAANNAIVRFSPGSGLSAVPAFPVGCSGTNPVVCNVGTLDVGQSKSLAILVQPAVSGTLSTSANVYSDIADLTLGNNAASAAVDVKADSTSPLDTTDLSASGDAPAMVEPGALVPFTMSAGNRGAADAYDVRLHYTAPPFSTIESFSASANLRCFLTVSAAAIDCELVDPFLAPGAFVSGTAWVRVHAPAGMQNFATLRVESRNPDCDLSNDEALIGTVAGDTSIDLTTDSASLAATTGESFTFTVVVANAGPAPLSSLVLEANLPASWSVISATPAAGTCTPAPFSCAVGTLDTGASVEIRVVARITDSGTWLGTFFAASGERFSTMDLRVTAGATSRHRAAGH